MLLQFISNHCVMSLKCPIRTIGADAECPIITVFCPIITLPSGRFTLNFAKNRRTMTQADKKIQSDQRRRTSAEAQQFSEDRIQLLDTIREMIDDELERRRPDSDGNPARGNLPPYPIRVQPPRRTLWQRIVSLFTGCLL